MKEELTRLIIEAIHGLPYDDVVSESCGEIDYDNNEIGLAHVMAALDKTVNYYDFGDGVIYESSTEIGTHICNWQLLKEDGSEATLEDQSEETKKALLTLFKG